ncbi:MAG: TIGR03546 family protein [Spirochaetaceae bacterium]|jgi:uncharacterized protein (TIGR03546 family)|nr:TIGR03546 family protein [Spirochaetaceae bacterium]
MIKGLAKLIVALNGNQKKSQIAAGFAWGVLLGFLPVGNAFWIMLFVLSFFLVHNQGAKVVSMAVLKLLMPLLYPLTDSIGWLILNAEFLRDFLTFLYNTPFVLFTRFNNTLVAGALAAGLVLWLPVFIIFYFFIPFYRNSLLPKILRSSLAKLLGNIPFIEKIQQAIGVIHAVSSD